MSKLFALSWRFLLAAALVFNPVAAGVAMAGESLSAKVQPAVASAVEMPPCHGMAMAGDGAAKPADTDKHRGHAPCHFGACCLVLSLHVPLIHLPGAEHRGLAPVASLPDAAKSPPAVRMIRPPIA